jgi:GntR family phosphonate transport system transcriptional regulator
VHARRGAGVFVQHRQMPYPIGKRVRFHQNLMAAGRVPEKRVLLLQTRSASPREAEALDLPEGDRVHVYEGLSLSDEVPIALFRSVFPARAPAPHDRGVARHRVRDGRLRGAWDRRLHPRPDRDHGQTGGCDAGSPTRLSPGAPILRSVGVNVDPGGAALEYGRTWFAGDRVTLTLGADAL